MRGSGDSTSATLVRPADEVGPRPSARYVARRDEGTIPSDSGLGEANAETDAHYRPRRREVAAALTTVGLALDDIDLVVNLPSALRPLWQEHVAFAHDNSVWEPA